MDCSPQSHYGTADDHTNECRSSSEASEINRVHKGYMSRDIDPIEISLTCGLNQSRVLPIEGSATDGRQIREDAQVRHVFRP